MKESVDRRVERQAGVLRDRGSSQLSTQNLCSCTVNAKLNECKGNYLIYLITYSALTLNHTLSNLRVTSHLGLGSVNPAPLPENKCAVGSVWLESSRTLCLHRLTN